MRLLTLLGFAGLPAVLFGGAIALGGCPVAGLAVGVLVLLLGLNVLGRNR
jgi:hypothetical protein